MGCSTVLQVRTHLEGHKCPSAVCFEMSLFLVLKGDWEMHFHKMWRYGRTYWQPFTRTYHKWQFLLSIMALQLMLPDRQRAIREKVKLLVPQCYIFIFCVLDSTVYMFFSTNNIYIHTKIYTRKFPLVKKSVQYNELSLIILTHHSQMKKLSFIFYLSHFLLKCVEILIISLLYSK